MALIVSSGDRAPPGHNEKPEQEVVACDSAMGRGLFAPVPDGETALLFTGGYIQVSSQQLAPEGVLKPRLASHQEVHPRPLPVTLLRLKKIGIVDETPSFVVDVWNAGTGALLRGGHVHLAVTVNSDRFGPGRMTLTPASA